MGNVTITEKRAVRNGKTSRASRVKWQYRTMLLQRRGDDVLFEMGQQGWELAAMAPGGFDTTGKFFHCALTLIFKRAVSSSVNGGNQNGQKQSPESQR